MTEVAVKKLQDDLGRYVERAWELVNAGVATWSGGKPQPPANPPKIKGRPTSDVVIEGRR